MQKKRVRVYKPDNSDKFMYQAGGMAPQGAGMMPSQGQGPDLQSIISTYAQAKGMSGEEANQLYNQIMQMPQDQQQQVIAQLTQELSSTQVPVARYGGDMGSKKRLMKKAIGGVSPNTTMENVVDNRRETVMNAIGANMARNLVDETYNEAQQAAQTFNPYAQPQMQFGGRSPFYGGMDPNNNPFMDDAYETQSDFKDAMGKLGNSIWNIGATMKPGNIKVKTKGDMFNRTKTQDKNSFFNKDVDENVIPDYLQFDTASQYNPSLGNYQPGGNVRITDQFGNTKLVNEDEAEYFSSLKQNDPNINVNNLSFNSENPNSQATNTTTNNNTNANTPSGALNGWHGGFFFQDGKVITTANQGQGQGQQQMGYSPSSFMNQRLDPFAYLNSPQGMQAFGTAMKGFQPDDVHLSKLKGRTGLFGNKFVAEWDYNQDGKGLAYGPNEMPERRFNFGFNRQDNNYGRFDQAVDAFKARRNDRRGETNYVNRYGQPTDQQSNNTALTNNMTGYSGSGMGAMEREDNPFTKPTQAANPSSYTTNGNSYNQNTSPNNDVKYIPGIEDYVDQTPKEVNYMKNYTYDPATGEYMYSGPMNQGKVDPYYFEDPSNPTGSTGFDPEKGFYATGGQAGRLVLKQGNGLFGDVNNMALASGTIATMNAASAFKNRTDIDENMTLADSINPVMMDSVDRNPMQQGLWGTGPLTGEEVPNLQPFNQGYRWSQGQGNGLMDQNQFSRYGGKIYQDGGNPATESKAGLYQQALAEREYFLQNPDMWKEDPEMQNEDGSFNLCLDCINVDYNDPNQVQDAARLINEGYSRGTHFSTDAFNEGLKKYNIPAPVYGSAAAKPVVKRAGGGVNFYQEGGVYELDQNEIDDIMRNGGSIEYFD